MSDLYYDYDPCYDCDEPEDYDHVDKVIDYNFIASIMTDRGLAWLTKTIHLLKFSSFPLSTMSLSEGSDANLIFNISKDHGWGWVDAQLILLQGIQFRLSLVPHQPQIDVEPF